MIKLLTSVAFAAAIASPALAQTANGGQSRFSSAYPYANSYGYQEGRTRSTNPAHDVYSTTGHYLGSDPDPSVRNQLARDPNGGN
jgi:hypothetical protein